MYRICKATSGYYYAQSYGYNGWKMFGPFCRTKTGARNVIKGAKYRDMVPFGKVVEYC